MAKKITELTAASSVASNDLLAIVDTSAGETKKVTLADLQSSQAGLLWRWNGTDVTQFDGTEVNTAGQSATLAVSASSATKLFQTLDIAATFAGAGGGIAYRVAVAEALTLPERFMVKMHFLNVPSGVRVGPFFYVGSSWGGSVVGTGVTFGQNSTLQYVQARSGAGFAPFELPGATPSFTSVGNADDGGMLLTLKVFARPGAPGVPTRLVGYFTGEGGESSSLRATTSDWLGAGPPADYNNVTLNSFGLVLQSEAVGTYTAKIAAIEVFAGW
jgi:hypothetical protein